MKLDFTREAYKQLITNLQTSGYDFLTYKDYCQGRKSERFVILRHDVDLLPDCSFTIAKMEHEHNIHAVYYFRAVPESWNDTIIKQISSMGHEVGYHYESLTTCNGDIDSAYKDFVNNLQHLRALTPINTICMHGSPKSSFDSKDIWNTYSFKELGIIGEPYLTTDFSKMLYLTDTGRRWDGYKVSVRDKIEGYQEEWNTKGWVFHNTDDIIRALQENQLPDQIMITTHPQRWFNFGFDWIKELVMQNIKNIVKAAIVRR